jgi:hypothetical protein
MVWLWLGNPHKCRHEKSLNIPNFPGVGKKEGKKGGEKPKGWEENP